MLFASVIVVVVGIGPGEINVFAVIIVFIALDGFAIIAFVIVIVVDVGVEPGEGVPGSQDGEEGCPRKISP